MRSGGQKHPHPRLTRVPLAFYEQYVFERSAPGVWNEAEKIRPAGLAQYDNFGSAVALWAAADSPKQVLAVGSIGESSIDVGNGAAYIYERSGDGVPWTLMAKFVDAGAGRNDNLGNAVAVTQTLAVVGASNADAEDGRVYVLERNAGGADAWGELKRLLPVDGVRGQFGLVQARSEREDRRCRRN